jgi:sec-independent protein translocase protein TatA
MGNLGPWEIGLICLAILLIFGPKRLPGIGRSVGKGMREFKDSIGGPTKEIREAIEAPLELRDALNPKKMLAESLNPLKEAEPAEAEVLEGEIVSEGEWAAPDSESGAAAAEADEPGLTVRHGVDS